MTVVRAKTRAWAPGLLVIVIALLVAWQLTNQIRLNHTNARLQLQAQNGQKALVRSCKLVPIGEKLYAWAARDPASHVTPADVELVVSTADTACSP